MKPKRKVSSNLGRTQYFQRELLYKEIKKRIGPVRRCPFYNGNKYPQFDEKSHDVLNPQFPNPAVPIEEFDFVIKRGRRLIPMEIKATDDLNSVKTPLLKEIIATHKLPYGIVVYGGAPFYDKPEKIWYWPFWLF